MSALFISSTIDSSLLTGTAREEAINRMYLDGIGVTHAEEYAGYVSIRSSIGARVNELTDPRDFSDLDQDRLGDYFNLVNNAELLIDRYGIEEVRARANRLYQEA